MKYIDSEKLIAEIERRLKIVEPHKDTFESAAACRQELIWMKDFITHLQQEQPEVDLEKFTDKIKTFQERYKYPEIVSIKGAMAFMARMFYQYPNVARQWYDSLPKATMD